jgi:nicotinamidase-related amidase
LNKPIHKRTFSCYENAEFRHALDSSGRTQVLVVGIESHVCVYQSARDMKRHGYEVAVAFDAISSRAPFQKEIAVNRMRSEGVVIVSSEMIACEWLKHADHPKFRDVMASIKR